MFVRLLECRYLPMSELWISMYTLAAKHWERKWPNHCDLIRHGGHSTGSDYDTQLTESVNDLHVVFYQYNFSSCLNFFIFTKTQPKLMIHTELKKKTLRFTLQSIEHNNSHHPSFHNWIFSLRNFGRPTTQNTSAGAKITFLTSSDRPEYNNRRITNIFSHFAKGPEKYQYLIWQFLTDQRRQFGWKNIPKVRWVL